MGIDDQRNLDEESRACRLTLVRGAAREPAPHPAPQLALVVNAERELFYAVMENDRHRVSTWLARGADVNARNDMGRTPLFKAVVSERIEPAIAELLLDRGADVRARDRWGGTPLHVAASAASQALLLDRGAEMDARDHAGRTPLHRVARLAEVEQVMLLVSRGADTGLRDHRGRRPLDLIRGNGLVELYGGHCRKSLERLLGGFLTAKVVAVRPDSLVMQVESVHWKYPAAEREAKERGMLIVPCGLLHEVPAPGDLIRCGKHLTLDVSEAWRVARQRDLGIEPVR